MDTGLVFGFLQPDILRNINELGNWKTRSSAIEQVQRGLASLGPAQAAALQQQLPQFVAFVQQLLQDHNFKVVTAGLSVLADAAGSLGPGLQQHLGELAPVLLGKLCDHRAPVAAAALTAASSILRHTSGSNPAGLVNKLLQLQQQEQTVASGCDCSSLLELLILAMLTGPVSGLDLPAAVQLLLSCMQQSTSTSGSPLSNKQHALVLEAFALATDSLGAQLPGLLKQAGGSDLTVTQVLTQVQQLQRPQLAADGSIRHNSAVQAAFAAAEAAAPIASFRIGSGLSDKGSFGQSSSVAALLKSDSSTGGFKASGLLSSSNSSKGGAADASSTAAHAYADPLSRPLSGAWQQQQQMPPGSLGAAQTHTFLTSMPITSFATGGGQGSSPPTSGRRCSKPQLSINSSSTYAGLDQPFSAGRSPLASPHALSAGGPSSSSIHSSSHFQHSADWPGQQQSPAPAAKAESSSSELQWQRQSRRELQGQLSNLQLCSSSQAQQQQQQQRQDAQLQKDAVAAGAGSCITLHADGTTDCLSKPLQLQTGTGPGPNLRYQQPSSSSVGSSTCSLPPRRGTGDQTGMWNEAGTAPPATAPAAAGNTGSSGGSSWAAAAGPGWAPADGSCSNAGAAGVYCSGRPETLSPSRGERLAQLKRRQVEKRAVSATGSARVTGSWDSQEGALTAGAAAAAGPGTLPGGYRSLEQLPRASTAGAMATATVGGWAVSSSSSTDAVGAASVGPRSSYGHAGHSNSCSPVPGEAGGFTGSSCAAGSGGPKGALLQWHIPTGPGGRVLPPGSGSTSPTQQQQQHVLQQQQKQQQQQQQRYSSSPEPSAGVSRAAYGSYSPSSSSSYDAGVSASRATHSDKGAGTAAGSSSYFESGHLLQSVPRTVSAAAVLVSSAAGADASASGSGSSANGSGGSSSTGYRCSRFQQPRAGSCSPAPGDASVGQGPAVPLGFSRANPSTAPRQQQQQLGTLQPTMGIRAQTAAPTFGYGSCSGGTGTSTSNGLGSPGSPSAAAASGSSSPTGATRMSGMQAARGCFSSSSRSGAAGPSSMSGGPASPTRSPAGTLSGRVGSGVRGLTGAGDRPQSVGAAEADMAGADLSPLLDPEDGLRQAILRLQQANAATRKEVDWQAQLDALVDARRLIAHHTEFLRPSARELVLAALPAVDDLRSTTSRMALLFFQELPGAGVSVEREMDEVVLVLLKKAGDLSTAGRDNFLAQEAAKALSGICAAASESRAISALIAAGANHKSPHVRSRAAAQLDEVAAGGRGLEGLLRSGNWPLLEKLFKTAAGFLQEGSLDTRTYGKRLLWAVKAVLRGNRTDMDRLMSGITPESVSRCVVEVLEGLQAPPPAPANRGGSAAGLRIGRPGQSSTCTTPTGGLSALQTAPPFSAPPAAAFSSAGGLELGALGAGRQGHGSSGSSGGSDGNAAKRALFRSGSSSNGSSAAGGLQIQGSAAQHAPAAGGDCCSPGSPGSSGRRRRSTATVLADGSSNGSGSRGGGPGSPCGTTCSPSGSGGVAAFGGVGSVSGSDRRQSGGGCPPGPPGPMSPELQEAVDQVGLQLCHKDWRNRMDALRALSALGPALPEVPNAALDGLLQALIGRLGDGNAKVNQKALEVLCEVACTIKLRCLLVMPNLMPALTANLGSSNDKLRSCASTALDVVAATVSPQPQQLVQGLAQAVANGSVRTKIAVVEKLAVLLPVLHQVQPSATKLLLPAAFSLAAEARGEAKAAAGQLLGSLAALLGTNTLLNAAAVSSSATEQRVRELLLGGRG